MKTTRIIIGRILHSSISGDCHTLVWRQIIHTVVLPVIGNLNLKRLIIRFVSKTCQHQNLLLNSEGFQLNVLDILAQDDNELSAYKDIYTEYRNVCKQLADFITQAEQSRKDEDYIRFQLEQLDDANLQEGEQTELEQEAETLNHAE